MLELRAQPLYPLAQLLHLRAQLLHLRVRLLQSKGQLLDKIRQGGGLTFLLLRKLAQPLQQESFEFCHGAPQ